MQTGWRPPYGYGYGGHALSSKTLIGTPNHECYVRIENMTTDMKSLQAGNYVLYGVRYSWSADVRRRSLAVISTHTHTVDSGRKKHHRHDHRGKPLTMNDSA
jgi:hypothetical protein